MKQHPNESEWESEEKKKSRARQENDNNNNNVCGERVSCVCAITLYSRVESMHKLLLCVLGRFYDILCVHA